MANTYLDKLGALREKNPPVGWDDSPYKVTMSPDILNDPVFSEYDLSQLRTYDQDPRLRDAITLGDRQTELDQKWQQHAFEGYTYMPSSPYNPNKVYIKDLDQLKMAVGPGAEQTKQGDINKETASTIAHEFRHTMFDKPEYQGILEAAYNRFGGAIPYYDINEMVTRAAEAQTIPGHWIGESLDDYQDDYNQRLIYEGMPAHLTPVNTTKQFNRSAREFFEKVRREKLKRPTQINIQKQAIGMPENLTTYTPPKPYVTPPRGGGADVMPIPRSAPISVPVPAHISGGGESRPASEKQHTGHGKSGMGRDKSKLMAHGGMIDIPFPGRRRDI